MKSSKLINAYGCLLVLAHVLTLTSCQSKNQPISPAPDSKPSTAPQPGSKEMKTARDLTAKRDTDPTFLVKNENNAHILYLEQGGAEKKILTLTVLKAGTKLYHWEANEPAAKELDKATKYDPVLLFHKVDSLERFEQGGGYYVSTSPYNTQMYGNFLMIVEPPHDLLIASTPHLRSHPEIWTEADKTLADNERMEKLNSINRGLRHAGVHGVIDAEDEGSIVGFYSLFHPDALTVVHGSSHPWLRGNEAEFIRLIRGEKVTDKDKSVLSHVLDNILYTTIATSEDPSLHSYKPVKAIVEGFRPEVLAALGKAWNENHFADHPSPERVRFLRKLKRLKIDLNEFAQCSNCDQDLDEDGNKKKKSESGTAKPPRILKNRPNTPCRDQLLTFLGLDKDSTERELNAGNDKYEETIKASADPKKMKSDYFPIYDAYRKNHKEMDHWLEYEHWMQTNGKLPPEAKEGKCKIIKHTLPSQEDDEPLGLGF